MVPLTAPCDAVGPLLIFFTQPFAVGPGERSVTRVHILGVNFSSPKSFLVLVTVVLLVGGILQAVWTRCRDVDSPR